MSMCEGGLKSPLFFYGLPHSLVNCFRKNVYWALSGETETGNAGTRPCRGIAGRRDGGEAGRAPRRDARVCRRSASLLQRSITLFPNPS